MIRSKKMGFSDQIWSLRSAVWSKYGTMVVLGTTVVVHVSVVSELLDYLDNERVGLTKTESKDYIAFRNRKVNSVVAGAEAAAVTRPVSLIERKKLYMEG